MASCGEGGADYEGDVFDISEDGQDDGYVFQEMLLLMGTRVT